MTGLSPEDYGGIWIGADGNLVILCAEAREDAVIALVEECQVEGGQTVHLLPARFTVKEIAAVRKELIERAGELEIGYVVAGRPGVNGLVVGLLPEHYTRERIVRIKEAADMDCVAFERIDGSCSEDPLAGDRFYMAGIPFYMSEHKWFGPVLHDRLAKTKEAVDRLGAHLDRDIYGGRRFIMEDGALGVYCVVGREDEMREAIERYACSGGLDYRLIPCAYSVRELEETYALLLELRDVLPISPFYEQYNDRNNRITVGVLEMYYTDDLIEEILDRTPSGCVVIMRTKPAMIVDC